MLALATTLVGPYVGFSTTQELATFLPCCSGVETEAVAQGTVCPGLGGVG